MRIKLSKHFKAGMKITGGQMPEYEYELIQNPRGISVTFEGRVGNCPNCSKLVREVDKNEQCVCGQKLNWGNSGEENNT